MIRINQLYIRINTALECLEFRESFSSKLNVITSYTNTKGKSTIGESILFCLGLEEILGQKNEKAVKPVLRSKIEVNGEEADVIQSTVFLEIENKKGEVITIERCPKNNDRDARLVSVHNGSIVEMLEGKCDFEDYFVHDPGAAKNIRGFHSYLQSFIGLELPEVATYEGKLIKLYLPTLISCFYMEQKKGWINVLQTLPSYYRIKDVKKRVLEYVMGLSILETEREFNIRKYKLKSTENEWELKLANIVSKVHAIRELKIVGLKEKPHIVGEEEHIKLLISHEGEGIELGYYLEELENEIEELNNIKEPTIENRSRALNTELKELDELLVKFTNQKIDAQRTCSIEEEQLNSVKHRLENIKKDLAENKDMLKLIRLGSLEDMAFAKSQCPTCGQSVDDTLFQQNGKVKIMTIEESIIHLESERQMLEFSKDAQQLRLNNQKEYILRIGDRLVEISSRIRIVKSDLISNNKAISQSHINQIVELELRKNSLETLYFEISTLWEELKSVGVRWGKDKSSLDEIPSDFINDRDKEILGLLRSEFTRMLKEFKFESTSISNIQIDDFNYLPTVQGFDLHFDSSASDTVRIIWAYMTALQYVANSYGNNFGFLIYDEPAQQNTDLSSARELLKELVKLSDSQQVFVFYKLESDELFNSINESDYFRIHSDDYLVKPIN